MQHCPFDRIPFDITAAIFEKLERNAGLECMVVSRQWREYACKCAKKAFEGVTLDANKGCQKYKALLDNIGLHVKNVLVKNCSDAAKLVDMMTLLTQNDCQYLTSLSKSRMKCIICMIILLTSSSRPTRMLCAWRSQYPCDQVSLSQGIVPAKIITCYGSGCQ